MTNTDSEYKYEAKVDDTSKKDKDSCCRPFSRRGDRIRGGSSISVFGLAMLGALIYFVSSATGFWMGVLGVLKAFVWPAILVYEILKYIGA